MLRTAAFLAAIAAGSTAWAVAPEDMTPVTPTPTTTTCTAGEVWDAEADACVAIEQSALPEPTLRETARELAYAGRGNDALALLARSNEPASSDVLTLRALVHGKSGRYARALPLYEAALTADADNLLARAYMGLALIAAGQEAQASHQLTEIRMRRGAGTWPDRALSRALSAGAPIGY